MAAPVTQQSRRTVRAVCEELVEAECRSIAGAAALVEGELFPEGQFLQDMLPSPERIRLGVELLTRPTCSRQDLGGLFWLFTVPCVSPAWAWCECSARP